MGSINVPIVAASPKDPTLSAFRLNPRCLTLWDHASIAAVFGQVQHPALPQPGLNGWNDHRGILGKARVFLPAAIADHGFQRTVIPGVDQLLDSSQFFAGGRCGMDQVMRLAFPLLSGGMCSW